jgi:hypothetical protein
MIETAQSKPKDIPEYLRWFDKTLGVKIDKKTENYYESVAKKICDSFKHLNFWKTINSEMKNWDQKYHLNTTYKLFEHDQIPELKIKPYSSLINKTFRKNILENENWPDNPQGEWLTPENWYSRINDIVRTVFVVKYLDGVGHLSDRIKKIAEDNGHEFHVDFEAKEEGYYAAHIYIGFNCEIPKEDWDTDVIPTIVELQVTTQLQEVIRRLLHKYYEKKRITNEDKKIKWQWEYDSQEFSAGYLGHILHYVEGMIVDIRNKQNED